ncbi:hypothetical protein BDB00DRAFT_272016 [Zychaea mexicana]|uniref:uncharacterized protein n=1 Tax=Zychaea mexicana TaxID=64656 RepID=UPI0022FE003E|nr:uncharacterized protein BDB00DRAFT_272016 [Zychaea mexicana]KAI9495120.1 hypothetical protein BDB00DRAFT_272016 [Zychaea mexicana]
MPPKRARGFGNKRVSSFASLKSNGARKVIRITQPLDLGGTLSVPPVVQPASKRSPMRDENTNSSNKRRKADNRAQSWANILPSLLTAYKQGYGIEEPAPQALVPIDDPLLCHCPESKRKEKTVTCIYKCGIRTATVKYCSECPDHSLPLVLMRRHLFPMTPSGPNHAVHIEQMRSFHNLHYICRVSVHSIASWAQAEYHQKLQATS